jgi:engulfment/cell motility protein 1
MMLINSLLAHADDSRLEEFIGVLEELNVRKAVVVCLRHYGFSSLTEL